jgi:hypothetical protein
VGGDEWGMRCEQGGGGGGKKTEMLHQVIFMPVTLPSSINSKPAWPTLHDALIR